MCSMSVGNIACLYNYLRARGNKHVLRAQPRCGEQRTIGRPMKNYLKIPAARHPIFRRPVHNTST